MKRLWPVLVIFLAGVTLFGCEAFSIFGNRREAMNENAQGLTLEYYTRGVTAEAGIGAESKGGLLGFLGALPWEWILGGGGIASALVMLKKLRGEQTHSTVLTDVIERAKDRMIPAEEDKLKVDMAAAAKEHGEPPKIYDAKVLRAKQKGGI